MREKEAVALLFSSLHQSPLPYDHHQRWSFPPPSSSSSGMGNMLEAACLPPENPNQRFPHESPSRNQAPSNPCPPQERNSRVISTFPSCVIFCLPSPLYESPDISIEPRCIGTSAGLLQSQRRGSNGTVPVRPRKTLPTRQGRTHQERSVVPLARLRVPPGRDLDTGEVLAPGRLFIFSSFLSVCYPARCCRLMRRPSVAPPPRHGCRPSQACAAVVRGFDAGELLALADSSCFPPSSPLMPPASLPPPDAGARAQRCLPAMAAPASQKLRPSTQIEQGEAGGREDRRGRLGGGRIRGAAEQRMRIRAVAAGSRRSRGRRRAARLPAKLGAAMVALQ